MSSEAPEPEAEMDDEAGDGSPDRTATAPADDGVTDAVSAALPLAGDAGTADEQLTQGEVFDLLSNERRRFVLRYLREHDGAATLGEMSTQIAAWEYDRPADKVSAKQRKRIYSTLQQTHLEKMDAIGVVTYDPDSGRVEATDELSDLEIYMEIVPGRELAWKEYYLALSLVTTALVAVVWAGIYPFSLVGDIVWAAVISLTFLVSAAAHVYYERSIQLGEE